MRWPLILQVLKEPTIAPMCAYNIFFFQYENLIASYWINKTKHKLDMFPFTHDPLSL